MDWLAPVAVSAAVVLLLLCLAVLGWRGRLRRQEHIPAPVPAPAEPGSPVFQSEGQYVVTTTAGDWLDRVAVHGLGIRSNATAEVYGHGLLLRRTGAPAVYIPWQALHAVRLVSGIAGKFVEKDGLVAISWTLGKTNVETGFRTRRASDKPRLLDAVTRLISTTADHANTDHTSTDHLKEAQ
jgi:hypothetical protein